MSGWKLVAAAALLYLIVMGLVIWPDRIRARPADNSATSSGYGDSGSTSHVALTGLPYRGVAMQLQRVDLIDRYKQSIDEIAGVGADTVSLVVDGRQEDGSSTQIYVDMRKTPTVAQLLEVINHAREKN